MREIIFRGKRANDEEWVYGGILHQTDFYGDKVDKWFIIDGTDTHANDMGYEYRVIPETIGQYTGLQDKNGNRIFEGDIITVPWSTHRRIVKFSDGQFLGVNEKKIGSNDIFTDIIVGCSKGVEVIGNIYDNPDLFEVTP